MRIIIAGSVPFEDVSILTDAEQEALGMVNYFEDAQIVIKCKDGLFTIPTYKISLIELKKARKITNPSIVEKVVRLAIGNTTFGPAYIVKPGRLSDAGLPLIFEPLDQFTFIADGIAHITTDFNVTLMQNRK